jgi:hypothetical protein
VPGVQASRASNQLEIGNPMTPSLWSVNLLDRLTELREALLLQRTQMKRHTGWGVWEGSHTSTPSPGTLPSWNFHIFVQLSSMLQSPLGLGGEMTQTLYAHMNKRKKSPLGF